MTPGQNYLQSFGEERKKYKRKLQIALFLLSFGIITTLLAWFVLKAPVFQVKAIEINGAEQSLKETVLATLQSQVASGSWKNKFLGVGNFLSWPDNFGEVELASLPAVKSAEVHKDYSEKKLTIKITERTPLGIWCFKKYSPAQCYWFDVDGVLFKSAFLTEGNLIKVVNDYSQEGLGINNKVMKEAFMPNLFSVLHALEDSGISIKEVGVHNIENEELEALAFNGPKLLFSLRFPAEGAADVIKDLKNKAGFKNLSYIDFRVEHRAYYK